MSETDKNVWSFLSAMGIKFSTLIYVATIAAIFYANWQIIDRQIDDIVSGGKARSEQIAALNIRIYTLERDLATMAVRLETLRDAVTELRRQSGLRTRMPSELPQ